MKGLIEAFSLERVGKAGAKFDFDKTRWFNQQYLRAMDNSLLADDLEDILKINGPIGLPINAQTPGEIAISIMSEIISCLRNQKYTMEELRENWNNR